MTNSNFQDLDEIKLHLKNLLIDDTTVALQATGQVLNTTSKHQNFLILFKARYNKLQKEKASGLISDDNYRVQSAQILNALTGFIDDFKEKDIKENTSLESLPLPFPFPIPSAIVLPPPPSVTIENPKPLVALLIFPNDKSLENLSIEEREIQLALLHFKQAGGNIEVITLSSVSELFDYFNLYKGQIGLIHYGGHASGSGLEIDGSTAQANGLANLMGTEPNLQFVFLNGCATKGQVQLLQENRVKTVLATAVPISDQKATKFAIRFYQNLTFFGGKNTLQDAFQHAKAFIETTETTPVNIQTRGFVMSDAEPIDDFKWALYEHPNFKNTLEWQLPKVGVNPNRTLDIATIEQPAAKPTIELLSNIERNSLEQQKIILEKKIAFFDNKIITGGLNADQEFAYLTQLETMNEQLSNIKLKLA